jgi:prepilin-type N-terminal cleavage/methylation domain-containing protein
MPYSDIGGRGLARLCRSFIQVDWIKCIRNRLLRAARREAGFTLIEVVFAISIFGVVSTALIGVLTSATAADGLARQKTIALELAQQQVEYVRQLSYPDVCISGGNPSCPVTVPATIGIQPTLNKRVMGLWYELTTSVRWVNDAVPTGVATGANYKRVRVTVTRLRDGKQLARIYTYVASASRAAMGGIDNAIINVNVLDYGYTTASSPSATAVVGATVHLYDGPSGHSSDVTDETGLVSFASLEPNPADGSGNIYTTGATAYYNVTAIMSGFETLKEELPPCTVPCGTGSPPVGPAHLQIGPSQTQATTIHLYRPATINLQVQVQDTDGDWVPYSGTANVYVGGAYPRGSDGTTITVAGGSKTIAATDLIGGEHPVSGATYTVGAKSSDNTLVATAVKQTVPNNYPLDLTSTFILQLEPVTATPKSCTVTVQKNASTPIPSARVDVIDGPGGSPSQAYATDTTNSSGTVIFTLPQTGDYDLKAWGTLSGAALSGGLTDQIVPNNLPTTGNCKFTVTVS